ncbi:NucA/NucB deoxyribonuclease domain-containing protein [Paenibacillus sp. P2(2022)]|uniref:NucA/NucB deoxyribonuclease domain-containing protein n=1 Tax=Paenibacillus TaxID=44249 RepID=UPI001C9DF42B|nr:MULTISPECIES: NucA/NucB deoxyribonuclease domain-containing protein [Paenibacillus]MBY7736700.1 sporulation protein [Paenibacillus polymyxa]MDG0053479.1 NucA/NucB deoxyribonuclease domain-containing protein [Paenibacillus sp. P2(2022)]
MLRGIAKGLIVFLLAAIFSVQGVYAEPAVISQQAVGYTLEFPSSRYPETGAHIRDAIAAGHSAVCTIDRDGAEENRRESLKGYPTKKGYDRDEWPMGMCAEGGAGADIRYITPSDNRGAGSWVSHQLDKYADGTMVRFIVK